MRVISGSARGRRLAALPGTETRPTTDRVKESAFNIWQFRVAGASLLDLFAGSGQIGIEALSRGAARAVFVERSPAAMRVIRKNIEAARVGGRAETIQADYGNALRALRGRRFDLIYLDPPYGGEILNAALKNIELFDILSSDGIILCESSGEDRIVCPEGLSVTGTYRYGTICLTAMRRRAEKE